jgi:hypothetical protein
MSQLATTEDTKRLLDDFDDAFSKIEKAIFAFMDC